SNAAATSDSAGSRPSSTDVPAGTSTLPAGKLMRSTADEIWRPVLSAEIAFCATVTGSGGASGSFAHPPLGTLTPPLQTIRSVELTRAAHAGQVRVAMTASSSRSGGEMSQPAPPSQPSAALVKARYHRCVISFSLNDEHEALRQTVREFARDVVAPVIGGY